MGTETETADGVPASYGEWAAAGSAAEWAELVSDALFVFGPGGNVRGGNAAFLRLTRCTAAEAGGRGRSLGVFLGCLHAVSGGGCGGAPACLHCGWWRAAASADRGERAVFQFRLPLRAGGASEYEVRVAPCGGGGGRGCLCDRAAAKRLRVLERALYHDALNQFAGVRNLLDLLDTGDPAQVAEYAGLIRESAAQMSDEIVWLRAIRDAEGGGLAPRLREVPVAEVAARAVGRARAAAEARQVAVAVAVAEGVSVRTDCELAGLSLGSLVLNAVEASRRGERVALTFASEGGRGVFRVEGGAALTPEVACQVFQRSFSTKGEGRGMGAYGARLLVEGVLAGTVWHAAGAPAAARFCLSLPLAGAEPGADDGAGARRCENG